MRTEQLYLDDIVAACDAIMEFVSDRTEAEFMTDAQLQSAVLYQFMIVGEASSRVSADLRVRHPHVPWRFATDLRNHVAHGYFSLMLPTVWETALQDVPSMRDQIAAVIAAEYPEGVE